MYPSFICIRHGESQHNERTKQLMRIFPKIVNVRTLPQYQKIKLDPMLMDGGLTALGRKQATIAAADHIFDDVDIVIVSPLRRALQTCQIIFNKRYNVVEIYVEPLLTESLRSAIDIGIKFQQSKQRFGIHYNFSKVKDSAMQPWFLDVLSKQKKIQIHEHAHKTNKTLAESALDLLQKAPLESAQDLKNRISLLKKQLIYYKMKSKKKIAIIGHSYTLRWLTATGFYENSEPINSVHFENCQIKQISIKAEGNGYFLQEDDQVAPFCMMP